MDNLDDGHPPGKEGRAPRDPARSAFVRFTLACSTAAARADFRVCNNTRSLINFAVGSLAGADYATEGLVDRDARLLRDPDPRTARRPLPLSLRHRYRRRGPAQGPCRCASTGASSRFPGIDNCWRRGLQAVTFAEIDTLGSPRLDDVPDRTGQVIRACPQAAEVFHINQKGTCTPANRRYALAVCRGECSSQFEFG